MPASRALPEPGEPLTTVLEARAARRRGAGEARRSEAKRAAEDGRNGDTARSRERHSMERRTALADARRPPASARPSAGGGSCARRARPSPAAHAPLAAVVQPLWRRGGRRGLRPPSLLRIHGRALRARRPGSRRRHALEDPPEAARSRMPRSPRRRAPLETRRAGEIQRPGSPREGEGVPTRPSRRRLGRKTDCGKRSDRYEHH